MKKTIVKGKKGCNPFDDVVMVQTTTDDHAVWSDAFTSCVYIGGMEAVDIGDMIKSFDGNTMEELCRDLVTSKAHNNDKLKGVSKYVHTIQNMRKVIDMNTHAIVKFEKAIAKQLWDIGNIKGEFKMEVLTGLLKGMHCAGGRLKHNNETNN